PAHGRSTRESPGRPPTQNEHYRQKRRFGSRLWLAPAAALIRFFKACLQLDITLGWDGIRFQALEPQLGEKDADLRGAAFKTGEVLDALDRFGNAGGWMLVEVGLDGLMMSLQFTGGAMKLQDFE